MDKTELKECIEELYGYAKKAIVIWNDYRMQQIRLETANLRKIEQSRQIFEEDQLAKRIQNAN